MWRRQICLFWVLGKKARLEQAFDIIKDRLAKALVGVPEETRKALEDGNTEFLRELHGAKRLYPDTDSREIPISQEKIEDNTSKFAAISLGSNGGICFQV